MAVTNYSKKCTCCGGNKWEYRKDEKLWICRYCGAQVERQEEYDGLYTIKNVVRQVILDSAYRRMDQADRNLSECQKINARYAGTLVAGICCRLIGAVSGQARDPKALLSQLRRDYQLLTAESKAIGDDESAVYEFLDSSDCWAALATVFDTLGDDQRREYLLTLTDASQVFSKETNKSLLRFALKNNRQELVDKIISNRDNIDLTDSLELLLAGPDSARKGDLAAGLLAAGALKSGDEAKIEDYLSCADSVATKARIAAAAMGAGLVLHMEILQREVLGLVELEELQALLGTLFSRRLYDGEIELLMAFAAAQKDPRKTLAVLDAMVGSGQFVSINVRQAQNFACSSQIPSETRREILQKLHSFSAADRMWETVAGTYLNTAKESAEDRAAMLDCLCSGITYIPARDFENYIISCTLDGEAKPERVRSLLAMSGMNPGFFRELAGNYLQRGMDIPSIRMEVLQQLMDNGIPIDGSVLVDYVCKSSDSAESKVELAQLAMRKGTVLRADALSVYLETCVKTFSAELFALLYRDGCTVTQKAMENYVLYCADSPAVKARNAAALASRMGIPLGSTQCHVKHNGAVIACQLAQGYLLTTREPVNLASAMVRTMTECGTKLNTDIQVNGKSKKFAKYVTEVRGSLSPTAEQICQEHRLFGRLFGF